MDRSNEQLRLLRLAQSGDTAAKEQLIRDNQALVWSIVKRYTGRGTEAEDLFQLGSIGLLKAIEGFDCTYGTRFSTYAVPKISGEIRRFLRDDGAMKVSRSVKELGYRVHTARETLHQTLSRPPTIHEIANWLEVSPEEIAGLRDRAAAAGFAAARNRRGRHDTGTDTWRSMHGGTRG